LYVQDILVSDAGLLAGLFKKSKAGAGNCGVHQKKTKFETLAGLKLASTVTKVSRISLANSSHLASRRIQQGLREIAGVQSRGACKHY
jgi:hypothetical protein